MPLNGVPLETAPPGGVPLEAAMKPSKPIRIGADWAIPGPVRPIAAASQKDAIDR